MTSPSLPGSNLPKADAGQRIQDFFENAPVGLWQVDDAGFITVINQRLLQWLGLDRPDSTQRRRLEDLVSPESAEAVQAIAKRCLTAGQASGVTLKWRGPQEGQDWLGEVVASAVYAPSGQWMGWRGAVRVVAQPSGEFERLLQERTLEAIERLASGVAHKFNNLLQVIQGYAELGLITLDPAHAVHGNLARIKEAAQRAAALVQGLVAFSRRQAVRRRQVDLQQFLAQVESRLQKILPAGIDLRLTPLDERIHIYADATSIEQAIIHLVLNACEAMPHGGAVVLDAHLARDGAEAGDSGLAPGMYACLSVSDTGGGIDPEIVGQVFEPFFTTKDTASGLGLAVVWGIAKQHGGRVEVSSQVGEGTTVRVYLPCDRPATS